MKKSYAFLAIMVFTIVGVTATPDESQAVPAFSRQTGNPCWACHFQHIPKLNAMGRNFKLNGFTDTSADLAEDENLSIPAPWFPISFISKVQFVKSSPKISGNPKSGAERGQWKIPDEAAFSVAGRAAENLGYSLEMDGSKWSNAKIMMPLIKGDYTAGLVIHTTDGHGPATGFEMLNNGLLRGQRGFEDRKGAYAAQAVLGRGYSGRSSGLGLFGGNDLVQVYASLWAPAWGVDQTLDTGLEMSQYARVTVTPELSESVSLGFGVAYYGGESVCVKCAGDPAEGERPVEHTFATDALVLDAQLQAEFDSGMSLEASLSYASAGDKGNPDQLFIDSEATSAAVMVGVTPQITLQAAYSAYTNNESGEDINTIVAGVWYSLFQNIEAVVEYSTYDGDGASDDNVLKVMLFSAF